MGRKKECLGKRFEVSNFLGPVSTETGEECFVTRFCQEWYPLFLRIDFYLELF